MSRLAPATLLLTLLLGAPPASALELKPAIGLTFTDVSSDPANGSASGKAGYQIGGTVLFGEKLYFEAGAFYAQKSTDITSSTPSGAIDLTSITGIRIPAMVGFHLIGEPKSEFTLRLFGGGSAFLVTSVSANGLTKSDFESPTWGVFAGAGVDFLFLFLDLKYEWSLTNVSSLSTVDVGSARSLYMNVGVKIPL
jgi:hypothetical protein